MEKFVAYNLVFQCEALTAVNLPRYNGTALRGAFFGALRQDFCLNKKLDGCLHCPTAEVCPICRLVATVEQDSARGAEIPRPFVLKPVISQKTQFEPGQNFAFGLTLFGQSLSLFPYVILAIQRMGEIGMGNRAIAPGRFIMREAKVTNPLSDIEKLIYTSDTRIVNVPDLPITQQDVLNYASGLDSGQMRINFLTPLRLVVESSLVQKMTFRIFTQRLLRRLTDLYRYWSDQELNLDFSGLLQQSTEIQLMQDNTHWVDLASYSQRRQASTPVGGLIGDISFAGNLREYLPLLVWGQITHVGKDATRGNGWYRIADNSS